MYNSTASSIFHDGKISEAFETTVGVKQGGVLSTLLFNIYINDLPKEISSIATESPHLFNSSLDSLLFADDLLLVSLSKEDLQVKLNVVETFCKGWGLSINIKKTKILIFNKAGAKIKKHVFMINDNIIESVRGYTYLGFTFTASGNPH